MGDLLHLGATILCPHAAQAQATTSSARVTLSGQPALNMAHAIMVSACPYNSGSTTLPCASISWASAALRVSIEGSPALLSTASGFCIGPSGPQGAPQMVAQQMRVTAT